MLSTKGYTLVVLNGALSPTKDLMIKDNFERFWTQSVYRVAVDGGLNSLFDLDKGSPSVFIPDTVCGDFDSIDQDILDEYKHYGVATIELDDQNQSGN